MKNIQRLLRILKDGLDAEISTVKSSSIDLRAGDSGNLCCFVLDYPRAFRIPSLAVMIRGSDRTTISQVRRSCLVLCSCLAVSFFLSGCLIQQIGGAFSKDAGGAPARRLAESKKAH